MIRLIYRADADDHFACRRDGTDDVVEMKEALWTFSRAQLQELCAKIEAYLRTSPKWLRCDHCDAEILAGQEGQSTADTVLCKECVRKAAEKLLDDTLEGLNKLMPF